MKSKPVLNVVMEEKLRDAILACQELELAILEAGEGRISADFLHFERVESRLVDVQYLLERYRDGLPQAHSLYKPTSRPDLPGHPSA